MTIDQLGKEKVLISSVIGYFNQTKLLTLEQTRNIIKKELLLYGPTTFSLPITEEFLHYESGK